MEVMVVTGASTGVGKATVQRFAGEGYSVCALARSNDKLAKLAEERFDGGGKIVAYPTDVSDSGQVEKTFRSILDDNGRIDVLVNNAGGLFGGNLTDHAMIDQIVDTNLKGTMYCTFAALPAMQAQKEGTIINIASIAGVDIAEQGNDGLYQAAKHGVVAFADALGRKVRSDGILISTLCPGAIDTPLWNEKNPYPHDRELIIRAEEVADLIAYILAQPRRTLFKNVIFVPTVESW